MRLRPPAVPLVTVDPYFSLWSFTDVLTDSNVRHWTGADNTLCGIVKIDGTPYRFMGAAAPGLCDAPAMKQTSLDVRAMSTTYVFEGAGVRLTARFSTPLLLDDPTLFSRPVSYLELNAAATDGKKHEVAAAIYASEQLCLDYRGENPVKAEAVSLGGLDAARIGSVTQNILNRSGDDLRIDWGWFYIACADAKTGAVTVKVPFDEKKPHGDSEDMTFVYAEAAVKPEGTLFLLAYDDIESIEYFGEHLKAPWTREWADIGEAVAAAAEDYDDVTARIIAFEDRMFIDSVRAGGEKYAELLELAYRQTIAAHKCVLDGDGELLFISKECFSNGCAATADVSYPSIPLYLAYNPELVRGMMRPIIKFARSDRWKFDFAPHDAGQYPLVNGQVYAGDDVKNQMPVEECGNMIIMFAAEAVASGDASYAADNLDLIETWVRYLDEHGEDPEHQLCTDDFAGHLAHNCNLSLKAVMGIAGLSIIYRMLGRTSDADKLLGRSKELFDSFALRAKNDDGSYRLAYDRPGTFSMKYNIVWDKLFGTGIADLTVIAAEAASYLRRQNAYGLPLDSRRTYTKSDWLVWCACLQPDRDSFEAMIEPLWNAYNRSDSRVPLTDWYDTVTARQCAFQNRTVQGGLYMKLLDYLGTVKL